MTGLASPTGLAHQAAPRDGVGAAAPLGQPVPGR